AIQPNGLPRRLPPRLPRCRQLRVRDMFRWFENRLDPFPPGDPVEPPRTLIGFCLHFTKGAWPYIAVAAVFNTAIALAEVGMFAFIGSIVDWLAVQDRETFLATEGWKLAMMAVVIT